MVQIHMGIMRMGLKTIGVPNRMGSLMLKIAGAMQTRPSVFRRLLLENRHQMFSARVQPMPPRQISAIPLQTSEVVRYIAVPPAATAATLAACAGMKMALRGPDQVQPEMPRE